jgi:hypothetical protein
MSIPTGHTVPYSYKAATNWLKNILKPEYFGIKTTANQLQKPLIKKRI